MSEYPAAELVIKLPDFRSVPDLGLGYMSEYPASELVIRLPDFKIPGFRVPDFGVRELVRVPGSRVGY